MRLVDYHSHTTRCGHATGEMEEYVVKAVEAGLLEFGVSDHSPWMLQKLGQRLAMDWEQLPGYVAEVRRLQEKYNRDGEDGGFRVRLGMEMDFIPCRLDAAREVIKKYPWDYVLGSVHNAGLGLLGDSYWSGILDKYPAEDVCDYYFHLVGEMVRERYCDVIGHLDVPRRFGVKPKAGLMKWIEPLIPAIRAAEIVVEINTSGRDYDIAQPMPGWEVIEALVAGGVTLTLGSDAHAPKHVGRYFAETVKRLRCLGVKEIARFERREVKMLSIEAPAPARREEVKL